MKNTLALFAKLLEAFINAKTSDPKAIATEWLDIVKAELNERR